ncbi:MAG: bifunctional methylenetetrahydrofolate dehydrogenase/methenyltetrahydrofolate cyclohydrolase FolD [Lachnospiraceae bacterium]
MVRIIDGKRIAGMIKDELKTEVQELKKQGTEVCLAVIQVGKDPASTAYIGIESLAYELEEDISQAELLKLIQELNSKETVHGILVQLPLPKHIDEQAVIQEISPEKDVDGFHPINVGNLCLGTKGFVSCTPAGIIQLLKRSNIAIEGKECVIVGRSNIVGKPMALLMLRENATVTVAHSRTKNLSEITKKADILIVAIGQKKFITSEYVKAGAVVIDVGMHRNENKKLCGDVDFDSVIEKAEAITPVPGGVGPMTIAMLMNNCVEAVKG